jgi:hypothetical protein
MGIPIDRAKQELNVEAKAPYRAKWKIGKTKKHQIVVQAKPRTTRPKYPAKRNRLIAQFKKLNLPKPIEIVLPDWS